jgi:hypothetical protein
LEILKDEKRPRKQEERKIHAEERACIKDWK